MTTLKFLNKKKSIKALEQVQYPFDFDFALKFNPDIKEKNVKQKASQKSIQDVQDLLHNKEVNTHVEWDDTEKQFVMFLKCQDFTKLCEAAEDFNIEKTEYDKEKRERAHLEHHAPEKLELYDAFIDVRDGEIGNEGKAQGMTQTHMDEDQNPIPKAWGEEIYKMEQFSKFTYKLRTDFVNKEKQSESEKQSFEQMDLSQKDKYIFEKVFTPAEQLNIKYEFLVDISEQIGSEMFKDTDFAQFQTKKFMQNLQITNLVEAIVPLHNSDLPKTGIKWFQLFQSEDDLNVMRNYFGENVATYFIFLEYFQKWLLLPVVVGILAKVCNMTLSTEEYTLNYENSPFTAFYGFFVVFWAAAFYQFWQRYERQKAIQWRSFGDAYEKNKKVKMSRFTDDDAHAERSWITGQIKPGVPQSIIIRRTIINLLKLVPVLTLVFFILILSLNIRGYIHPNHSGLMIDFLYDMSLPGGTFDKLTNWGQIPNIVHVIIFVFIGAWFKTISIESSEKENHETIDEQEDSITTKRYMFDTFITYSDLCYIAFYNQDVENLHLELASYFWIDEIRRVLCETVLPLIFKAKNARLRKKTSMTASSQKKADQITIHEYSKLKLNELSLDKYEPYDDYLEVVINFSYMTLFATAFPLMPVIMFVFHWLELKSDRLKVFKYYQRPLANKNEGIGIWNKIILITVFISVFSNIFIFAVSSEQLKSLFPYMFKTVEVKSHGKTIQKERMVAKYFVFAVFAMEHVILVSIYFMRKAITMLPDWTKNFYERRSYREKEFMAHSHDE